MSMVRVVCVQELANYYYYWVKTYTRHKVIRNNQTSHHSRPLQRYEQICYKCGINLVQATVSYTPGGSDRKLRKISTTSIRRAAMYAKQPVIKMITMKILPILESESRNFHFRPKINKAEQIERDTDDDNTVRHALRHSSCSVRL
jgi:hypothetical protein